MALTGLIAGMLFRGGKDLLRYGVDAFKENQGRKIELENQTLKHAQALELINITKDKDIDLETIKSITAQAEATKYNADAEKTWIEASLKLQNSQIAQLPYFEIKETYNGFIAGCVGFANFLTLLMNLVISAANIFKGLQQEILTLLVGYLLLTYANTHATANTEFYTSMLFLFEMVFSYRFLSYGTIKNQLQKKN